MPGQKNRGKARNRKALEEGATVAKLPEARAPRGTKRKQLPVVFHDFDTAAPEPDPHGSPESHRQWQQGEAERVARKTLCERLGVNPWRVPELQADGKSRYTDAHYEAVLILLADGWLIARQQREFPGLPSRSMVYERVQGDKEFSGRFTRANQLCDLVIEEGCFEIAEDGTNDWIRTDMGPMLDREHVTRSKLRIDTRLQLLKIRNRKRYGDKVDVDADVRTTVVRKIYNRQGGGDGNPE